MNRRNHAFGGRPAAGIYSSSRSPARLGRQRRFTLADQQGDLIARSSRLAEPFICEAVDEVLPPRGRVRLLEIACGSAAYIRYAAARNPELTALGLELQPDEIGRASCREREQTTVMSVTV